MSTSPAAVGIDVGSATTKCVAVDASGTFIDSILEPTHPRIAPQVQALLERFTAGATRKPPIVGTGYGRKLVAMADRAVTEITCHARGVFETLHRGGTLVDIGGQDSKVIVIDDHGQVVDFVMNDKCAAGTGRFLEHMATRMEVPLDALGDTALSARRSSPISSTCTVFAESEVVSLLAEGVDTASILAGLHRALISRVVAMIRSVGLRQPLLLSGGVARNRAVQRFLSEALGEDVQIPPHPQLMGAYGAALIALHRQG